MTLNEARALYSAKLCGQEVDYHELDRAKKVIDRHAAIRRGHKGVFPVQSVHEAYRRNLNEQLGFKLALACGLLDAWKERKDV